MRRATSSWSIVGGTLMTFVRITSAMPLLRLGDEEIAQARDAAEPVASSMT